MKYSLLVGLSALGLATACTPSGTTPETRTVVVTPPSASASSELPPTPKLVDLDAGSFATCAVSAGGTARCWGTAMYPVAGNPEAGFTMEGDLPFDIAGVKGATAIRVGSYFGCVLGDGGRASCFGNLPWKCAEPSPTPCVGEPLQGGADLVAIDTGPSNACGVTAKGNVRCWGYGEVMLHGAYAIDAKEPIKIEGVQGAVEVAVGSRHACARLADGRVTCWGANKRGQLGDGTRATRTKPVIVEGLSGKAIAITAASATEEPVERNIHGDFTCALMEDGTVHCWGSNEAGQLGAGTEEWRTVPEAVTGVANAVDVSAGTQHACALLSDRTVTCWGRNREGQIGKGSGGKPLPATPIVGITGATILSAGGHHTCAGTKEGVQCWGQRFGGELLGGWNQPTAPRPIPGAIR